MEVPAPRRRPRQCPGSDSRTGVSDAGRARGGGRGRGPGEVLRSKWSPASMPARDHRGPAPHDTGPRGASGGRGDPARGARDIRRARRETGADSPTPATNAPPGRGSSPAGPLRYRARSDTPGSPGGWGAARARRGGRAAGGGGGRVQGGGGGRRGGTRGAVAEDRPPPGGGGGRGQEGGGHRQPPPCDREPVVVATKDAKAPDRGPGGGPGRARAGGTETTTACEPTGRGGGGVRAPPAGLEPATGGLEGRCSIQLSYGGEGPERYGGGGGGWGVGGVGGWRGLPAQA